jgi:hypothetical protein
MTLDYGRHRKIRREIIDNLKDSEEIYCSHEDEKNIKFFRKIEGRNIHLAEPDIVVKKDNRILVVEIELSNSPKHLMGVSFAIHASEQCEYKKQSIDIKQKSLLLVLDSKKIFKKGSGKPKQIQEIKSLINNLLRFEYFYIVTEETAVDVINRWIHDKEAKGDICD